jgi:excinuclease ABC subunit A
MFTPIKNYPKSAFNALISGDLDSERPTFEGIIPQTERLYKNTDSEKRKLFFENFMSSNLCDLCGGKRLRENILNFKIDNKSIIDVTDFNIKDALNFFKNLNEGDKLTKKQKIIASSVLKEIITRLTFLEDVGLGYLNLSRSASTLSGGEAQRIRLATQIGANLMGVLYVLDEPSIGLHQRDNDKLINTLKKLRDVGNSLIVVEHDEDTIREADYVIDMGPGAGEFGGEIVAIGTPKEIEKNKNSLTGAYLRAEKKIEIPKFLYYIFYFRRNVKTFYFLWIIFNYIA